MHAREAILMPQCESFPDAIFSRDKICEALAYLREPDERCYVADGDLFEDLDDDFLGHGGDGTWWRGGEVCWRGLAEDGKRGEGTDEGLGGCGEALEGVVGGVGDRGGGIGRVWVLRFGGWGWGWCDG